MCQKKGWLENFKAWISLYNFKITEESVSADHMAKGKNPENFKKQIIKEDYLPQQVINPDDAGPVWKKMPPCTFTFKNDKASLGFKLLTGHDIYVHTRIVLFQWV